MVYICPVCGFAGLEAPPANYEICDCCDTEFGYTDRQTSHAELRQRWIAEGAHWHSIDFPAPPNWSPVSQLRNIDYEATADDLRHIKQAENAGIKTTGKAA